MRDRDDAINHAANDYFFSLFNLIPDAQNMLQIRMYPQLSHLGYTFLANRIIIVYGRPNDISLSNEEE